MAETEIELTREMYDAYINLTHPPNFNLNDTQLEDPAITKLSSAAGAYQSIIHFESLRRSFIHQLINAQADIIPFKTADGFLPHGEVEIQNFAENKKQIELRFTALLKTCETEIISLNNVFQYLFHRSGFLLEEEEDKTKNEFQLHQATKSKLAQKENELGLLRQQLTQLTAENARFKRELSLATAESEKYKLLHSSLTSAFDAYRSECEQRDSQYSQLIDTYAAQIEALLSVPARTTTLASTKGHAFVPSTPNKVIAKTGRKFGGSKKKYKK